MKKSELDALYDLGATQVTQSKPGPRSPLDAALSFEAEHGTAGDFGTLAHAQRVEHHLEEKPDYYEELLFFLSTPAPRPKFVIKSQVNRFLPPPAGPSVVKTPPMPDLGALYFQPKDEDEEKKETERRKTRRKGSHKPQFGIQANVNPKPSLRYEDDRILEAIARETPERSERAPLIAAVEQLNRYRRDRSEARRGEQKERARAFHSSDIEQHRRVVKSRMPDAELRRLIAHAKKAFGVDLDFDELRARLDTPPLVFKKARSGPYFGPRGGKYADPQHKTPWRESVGRSGPRTGTIDIPDKVIRAAVDDLMTKPALSRGLVPANAGPGVTRQWRTYVDITDATGKKHNILVTVEPTERPSVLSSRKRCVGGMRGEITPYTEDGVDKFAGGHSIQLKPAAGDWEKEKLAAALRDVLAHELTHVADPKIQAKLARGLAAARAGKDIQEVSKDSMKRSTKAVSAAKGHAAYLNLPEEVTASLQQIKRDILNSKVSKDIKGDPEWMRPESLLHYSDRWGDVGEHYTPKNKKRVLRMLFDLRESILDGTSKEIQKSVLHKGQARGGKYTKRVPYTDAKGRKKFRYYYAESAVARTAQAGELIKIGKAYAKVEEVTETEISVTVNGKRQNIKREDWGKFLSRHYGERYHEWAGKRAQTAVNAVLKHVPRALLSELPTDIDEAMKVLQKRVPDVYAKLEKSFQRAGMAPRRAKRVIASTLERRGWDVEARAAMIGSVLQGKAPSSVQDTIRAAENIAGGGTVTVGDVGMVIELVGAKPRERIDEAASKAEQEIEQLKGLLSKLSPEDVAQAGLSAPHIQALLQLAQAFPGLKDRAVEPAQAMLGQLTAAMPTPPKTHGTETPLFVAGAGGVPTALRARYRLMEAKDVRASHDPTQGFKKRGDYPSGVQERSYHSDPAEQLKVKRNADSMNVEFVVNTNPDAVNGPPMVTPDGVALGGNSRAMSMQLAYEGAGGAKLKEYLSSKAGDFGFTAEDVAAMERPILVREMVPPAKGYDQRDLQLLVRQMNESFTQAMDPRTMQVAMGRKLSDDTVTGLADSMEDGETLAAFLSSNRAKSFVSSLRDDGIIDDRNSSQYIAKGGSLNDDGKRLVERILVGRTVEDADLLSNTPARIVSSLARAVPAMVQAEGYGGGYKLKKPLQTALSAYNDLQTRVREGAIPALDSGMDNPTFEKLMTNSFDMGLFGDSHPVMEDPAAKALLGVLIAKPGVRQMSGVFNAYATAAGHRGSEAQSGMFATAKTPTEVLQEVVARETSIYEEPRHKAA